MAEEDKFADEMLTDDELDNVAGGNCYEKADDTRFLNSLNGPQEFILQVRLQGNQFKVLGRKSAYMPKSKKIIFQATEQATNIILTGSKSRRKRLVSTQ